jgi:signal transduction histidine kinase
LISALLLTIVVIFTFVAYRQISHALVATTRVKMNSAARLLANSFETSGRSLRRVLGATTSDSAIVGLLTRNDAALRAGAQAVLARDIATNKTALGAELRDRNGKRIVWADGPAIGTLPSLRDPASDSLPFPRGTTIGPFMREHGVVVYQVVVPVVTGSRDTVGFLLHYRELLGSENSTRAIRDLIGSNAGVLIGNTDGRLWTDLASVVPGPHRNANGTYAATYTAADGTERIGAAVPVNLARWTVWVDVPLSEVLVPAHRLLRNMVIAAALLVLLGALGAMFVSRQITDPLRAVTSAAQGIASGDYSRRVRMSRQDELGLLATSFNTMAEQVEDGRRDMEERVAQRTRELKDALSELHQTQEALVLREKLVILGQLAGGVGHELRNPLGVMTNAIYYLTIKLKSAPDDVKEYLGILRTQVGLSEKIVGDLLDFARVKQPNTDVVSLPSLVDEQLARIGPQEQEGITVERDFPPDLPSVNVDRVQMGQVILNLVSNAMHAMAGGGTLTVRAREGVNGVVTLDVVDTGVGMTSEQLAKMFDPLYTTKARGIGLGLSVSRSLAQANGGEISAESEPGVGSTVTVSFPSSMKEKVA